MEVQEYIPSSLMHDRSIKIFCPKTSGVTVLSYSVSVEEFLGGNVPSTVYDKNPFREFPCRYCTMRKRNVKLDKEGVWNEFECMLHKGKVVEVGFLDHKGTSQQNLFNISLE
jgi:hypothetical protein